MQQCHKNLKPYTSDSQTVCRGTLVRRERFSSVPQNFLENMSLDKQFLTFSIKFSTRSNDQVRITLLIFLVTIFYGTQFSQY